MVGQLPRNAKAKASETGITCRSFPPALKETQNKPNQKQTQQHKPNKHKTERCQWKTRKKGETKRAPKPLMSSLPSCSVSSLPSMWKIRCPSCPLLHPLAQAGLSHLARVVAVWAGMCPLLLATALHSNPYMYQSRHEHPLPCPWMHVWSH